MSNQLCILMKFLNQSLFVTSLILLTNPWYKIFTPCHYLMYWMPCLELILILSKFSRVSAAKTTVSKLGDTTSPWSRWSDWFHNVSHPEINTTIEWIWNKYDWGGIYNNVVGFVSNPHFTSMYPPFYISNM